MINLPSFSDVLNFLNIGGSSSPSNGGSLAPYSPPSNANDIVWQSDGNNGSNILGSFLGGISKGMGGSRDTSSNMSQSGNTGVFSDVGSQEELPLADIKKSTSPSTISLSPLHSKGNISEIAGGGTSSTSSNISIKDLLSLGRTGAANSFFPPEERRSSVLSFGPGGKIYIGGELITGSGDSFGGRK